MRNVNAAHVVATCLLAVGFVLTAFAGYSNANSPAGDANIGAGMLFILGMVIGLAGIVSAVIALLVHISMSRKVRREERVA